MKKNILSLLVFITGWSLCLFFHNSEAGFATAILAIISLYLYPEFMLNVMLVFIVSVVCYLHDMVLINYQLFTFKALVIDNLWLLSMWMLIVASFTGILSWLRFKPLYIVSLVGGIIGLVTFAVGYKLKAIFTDLSMPMSLGFHFVDWLILFPVAFLGYFKLKDLCKKHLNIAA